MEIICWYRQGEPRLTLDNLSVIWKQKTAVDEFSIIMINSIMLQCSWSLEFRENVFSLAAH